MLSPVMKCNLKKIQLMKEKEKKSFHKGRREKKKFHHQTSITPEHIPQAIH